MFIGPGEDPVALAIELAQHLRSAAPPDKAKGDCVCDEASGPLPLPPRSPHAFATEPSPTEGH